MDDEPTSSHRPGDSAASRRMCGSADSTASDSDTADDAPLLASGSQTVRIDMPASEKPASPHERSKALLSFILLAFAAVLNEIVLSFVHERVPETPPLPDITFSLIPYYKDGLKICEYIMLASFASVLLLMLFHRHRCVDHVPAINDGGLIAIFDALRYHDRYTKGPGRAEFPLCPPQ
ncbi:hypothetical protein OSTOST_06377 [Ostertagia ostertagi]